MLFWCFFVCFKLLNKKLMKLKNNTHTQKKSQQNNHYHALLDSQVHKAAFQCNL